MTTTTATPITVPEATPADKEAGTTTQPWYVLTLLALFSGVAGTLLGKAWEARSDKKAWIREQRLRVYALLNQHVHAIGKPLSEMATAENQAEGATVLPTLNAGLAEIASAVAQVELLGPAEVVLAAKAVEAAVDTAATSFLEIDWNTTAVPNHEALPVSAEISGINTALATFLSVAQKEIL